MLSSLQVSLSTCLVASLLAFLLEYGMWQFGGYCSNACQLCYDICICYRNIVYFLTTLASLLFFSLFCNNYSI